MRRAVRRGPGWISAGCRILRVISDSIPWKDELLKIADRLERRKVQRRWVERTSFLVERDIMISAYALRKLLKRQDF